MFCDDGIYKIMIDTYISILTTYRKAWQKWKENISKLYKTILCIFNVTVHYTKGKGYINLIL